MKILNNVVYKQIHYIYWRKEANIIRVNQEEFENIYKDIKKEKELIDYTTKRECYSNQLTYSIKVSGNYKMLFTRTKNKYFVYTTNTYDNTKNELEEYSGSRCMKLFRQQFTSTNNISLKLAFGTVPESFKRCVPKQLAYVNQSLKNIDLKASSLDGCSQYPSNMCGRLPDSNTMIEVKGRVEPNEEYPFAFYKSGHLAEYGVLDTHNWTTNKYYSYLFRFPSTKEKIEWPIQPCKDEDEVTYLMKASKYTLDDIWKYFYERRKTDKNAKLIMVAAIGCMHRRKYIKDDKYAHLAAIAIARGNQKIIDKARLIGYDKVIQICVDGIIYKGSQVYGVDHKGLGLFYQEFTDCDFKISSYNKYIVMKDNVCIKEKHSGCDLNIKSQEEIKDLNEQYKWEKKKDGESL